ncbi:MAG: tungstate ABC transporter substrate-binding protein WtpA [Candidatus Bathyarchaeota archaeon]|nr:tungstate ABC transporter substrate-binding protein WtpA [Candidatus Bathyarchaeota archaeon]
MKMKQKYAVFAVVFAVVLLSATYFFISSNFSGNEPKRVLTVYCATSLMYPLAHVEESFEAAHPNVDVQVEGHGTIQVIRHVTEMHHDIDVLLAADYSLIPNMMYQATIPGTDESYADYYVRFATNELVLAYLDSSRGANEINESNWYEILMRPEVQIGFANPQLAAMGYRTLSAVQLAQDYYNSPTLFHDLITANMEPPINSVPNGENQTIIIPEVQEPKTDKLFLRSSEVDLIGLLQTCYADYCFLYLSNAIQYGFEYIELPDEINLGAPQFQDTYEKIQLVYRHQRYSTVSLDRSSEVIYYGLTIPKNAPNQDLAEEFIEFLLDGQGRTDFAQDQHPIFAPCYTDNLNAVPESLKHIVVPEG